jgi:hypothetical protein
MPDSRLDELYRQPPDRFVAARNRLAKDLRAAGEADDAAGVKKLRRPTVAAWIINRAALKAPDQVGEFAAASAALEDAQAKAVEGAADAASAWREAAAREREAIAEVLGVAEGLARDAGHAPNPRAMELVDETLRAASADRELRERVVAGRLEREQSAASLGTFAAAAPPKRKREPPKRRETAQARRELARLDRALRDAARREEEAKAVVERAEEALRDAKARRDDAKRRMADLDRQRRAARRRAGR